MTAYTIGIQYEIKNEQNANKAKYHGSTIDPTPPQGSKTGVNGTGDITMDKGDTATITYSSVTSDWDASELQLKDKNKTGWAPTGSGPENNQLTADEATDYPDVDAHTGSKSKNAAGVLSISNDNKKATEVNYRVALSNGTSTVWSDPRIKDNGN